MGECAHAGSEQRNLQVAVQALKFGDDFCQVSITLQSKQINIEPATSNYSV